MCYDERKVKKVTIVGLRSDIAMETGYQKKLYTLHNVMNNQEIIQNGDVLQGCRFKFEYAPFSK